MRSVFIGTFGEVAVSFISRSGVCSALLVATLVILTAPSASAQCDPNITPTVTVTLGTWQSNGILPVTVNVSPGRPDGFPNTVNLWIDVVDDAHKMQYLSYYGHPVSVNLDTSCLADGSHTLFVQGNYCAHDAWTSAGFTVSSIPTVSGSFGSGFNSEGSATLTVTYDFENTRDQSQRELIVERDGVRVSSGTPVNVSGTYQFFAESISCLPTGTHTFVVRARPCGDATREAIATLPVSVDTTPQVTVSLGNPDSNGNVLITGHVIFPNAPGGGMYAGRVDTFVNDEATPRWSQDFFSGSSSLIERTMNVTCAGPYTVHVVATACSGNTATQQASGGQPGMTQPLVTLEYLHPTPSGPSMRATVKYAFPLPSSGWNVNLQLLPSVKEDGTLTAAQDFGSPNPVQQSGTWVVDFIGPLDTRQLTVAGTMTSCLGSGSNSASREVPICCSGSPTGTADPVGFADGDVRYSDGDPLPRLLDSIALSRTYDSQEGLARLFGKGWTTFLDQRLLTVSSPASLVYFSTAENGAVIFRQSGSTYVQQWPKAVNAAGTLTYNAAAGEYQYRPPNSAVITRFRGSDGRFAGYRQIATGRAVDVAWDANQLPTAATDSWSGLTWQFHTDAAARRVTSIDIAGRSDLLWTFTYDSTGLLLNVGAPGASTWRTYTYGTFGMTGAYDPLGNLIEAHTYDANGFGASSTGPTDEISSIQFGLAAASPDDRITRVTTSAGATIDYTLRASGGTYRTVHVTGGCAACGARNAVYVLDDDGRILRQQSADGYVTERTYSGSNLASVRASLQPSGCDPQTASDHCRLTENTLAGATLVSSPATMITAYTYGDALWPDRPTRIETTSVLQTAGIRAETLTYDATTGELLSRSVTGWTGSATLPVSETDTTTTALYGSNEVASFNPGGAFNSAWLTLPQPANERKSIDGPRTDVSDVTSFVYYPIDSTVTAAWRGRLAAVKNAAGQITRYENYDVFGNAQRVVDPNGVATESTSDGLGRLLTSTLKGVSGCNTTSDPLCASDLVTSRTYASTSGPLASQTDANGNVTTYEYDTRGRIVALSRGPSSSSLKERIEYTYDPATAQKSMERYLAMEGGSWVEKRRESFSYDTLSQLIAQTHADNASAGYAYDDLGSVIAVRDENHTSANTTYGYDAARRLSSVKQTLGAGQITTAYTYDVAGNLASVTDPNGNVTTYVYDDFGRMLSQMSPVTGLTKYSYDAAGDLLSTTDANNAVTTRTYDALGRALTSVATLGAASETVTWSYDGAGAFGVGRLASMSDPAGSTAYTYDRRGLLLSESRTSGSVGLTSSFKYDAAGNRTAITYPSGFVLTYAYDHAGRPLSLSSGSTSYMFSAAYLPFGPETSLSYANGTTQTRTYDTRYRIQRNTLTGPSGTIADYSYGEDAVGNITAIHDMVDAGYNRDFGYDDLNRLTTANTGLSLWATGSYRYDAMGNLAARDLGGMVEVDPNNPLSRHKVARSDSLPAPGAIHETYTYVGTTSKLSAVTFDGVDHTLTYDAAGNETRYYDPRTYSPRNLLSSITEPSEDNHAHTVSYGYDGRGVRLTRSEGTSGYATPYATRYYVYSPELQLLSMSVDDNPNLWGKTAIANSVPQMKHEIAWFNGRPVGELVDASTIRYTFTDHLGTPLLQTDSAATVTWRAEYEPYGDLYLLRTGPAPADQPLRFPGQEYERRWEGTEERYNIFRWYRAGWGRYTQADPIGTGGPGLFRADGRVMRFAIFGARNTRRVETAPFLETSQAVDLEVAANPYSYVNDSVLSATDPLGLRYILCEMKRFRADGVDAAVPNYSRDPKTKKWSSVCHYSGLCEEGPDAFIGFYQKVDTPPCSHCDEFCIIAADTDNKLPPKRIKCYDKLTWWGWFD